MEAHTRHLSSPLSPLLALPEAVLREVVSWSRDSSSANALLSACSASHRLRRDPAAAALLLLRCRCQDYDGALAACGAACQGGAAAVVQQALQLLAAGPESGGPFMAPPPLVQAMLRTASAAGDVCAIRSLLALPQPPNVNADAGWALESALVGGPHLAAVQALLEGGADPCIDNTGNILWAAGAPDRLPALQLLLRHCPDDATRCLATADALLAAIGCHTLPAIEHLLPLIDLGPATVHPPRVDLNDLVDLIFIAIVVGNLPALCLLLSRWPPSLPDLQDSLDLAVVSGHPACLARLLDEATLHPLAPAGVAGILSDALGFALHASVRRVLHTSEDRRGPGIRFVRQGAVLSPAVRRVPVPHDVRRHAVELLLERGAPATWAVVHGAARAGLSDIATRLQNAAVAAGLEYEDNVEGDLDSEEDGEGQGLEDNVQGGFNFGGDTESSELDGAADEVDV